MPGKQWRYLAGGVGACVCQLALGQAALEEVVVTAQKREQGLLEAPISITAFTAEHLARTGATNLGEFVDTAPNVNFDFTAPVSGASNAAAVFIRGVGQQDFALTTEAGVGTYVDGVYMSRSIGGVIDVLDVERVEVLRGPQGTLFGRNAIGGAISIVTRKPDLEESWGTLGLSVGNLNRRHLDARANLAINDKAAITLGGVLRQRDGYVDRVFGTDPGELMVDSRPNTQGNLRAQGEEDRYALRAALRYLPTDSLTVDLAADYARGRETSAANVLVGITDSLFVGLYNTVQAPSIELPGFSDALYSEDNFVLPGVERTLATGPNRSEYDSVGASLTLDWELGSMGLKSITAYRETEAAFFRDADGSPVVFAHTQNPDYQHDQFSQEFQLTGEVDALVYAAGVYYFHETGSDPLLALFPESFGQVDVRQNDIENTSVAVYGQATYSVTDRLALTAGIRYTEDEKEFKTEQFLVTGLASPVVFGPPPGTAIPLVPLGSTDSQTFEDVSPRISIEYRFGDNLNTYLSYSEGFKSGGFNLRYVLPVPGIVPFAPEEVDTFEAGLKWRSANGRYQVSAAVFTSDYQDIQTTLFDDNAAPITTNAGDADIDGFELEIALLPVDDLLIEWSLGLIDAEYTRIRSPSASITGADQIVTLDSELPNTPEVTSQLSLDYQFTEIFDGPLRLRLDAQYRGDTQNDAQNSPFLFQDSYIIGNASLAWTRSDEQWMARLFINNIGDERVIVSGDSNFALGFHEANINRPREYGLTVERRF